MVEDGIIRGTTSPFAYKSLARKESIRVLHIDSIAINSSSVFCTLLHVYRYDSVHQTPWMALSYRWGDESDLVPVMMREMDDTTPTIPSAHDADYGLLNLPRSTLDMMLELYHSGWIKDQWVWIDYICINQQDLAEKSAQVLLMDNVYRLSAKTLVYTGKELPSAEAAMRFWYNLDNTFEKLPRINDRGELCLISYETLLNELNISRSDFKWIALKEMLTVPWFGRLWVIQEAVLSIHLVFIWGKYSLTWPEFVKLRDWDYRSDLVTLLGLSQRVWTAIAAFKGIAELRENREGAARGWRCDISRALYRCNAAVSSDPRDRIYGLLGLLYGPDSAIDIVPDYAATNTADMVFREVTIKWTAQHDSYDLIYAAGFGLRRRVKNLPSWVPDYSLSLAQYPGKHLRAGKGDFASVDIEPLTFDGIGFATQAYIIDTVVSTLSTNYVKMSEHETADTSQMVASYLENALHLMSKQHPFPWPDDVSRSFVRSITRNTVVNSDRDGGSSITTEYDQTFASLDIVRELGVSTKFQWTESTPLQRQRFFASVAGFIHNSTVGLSGTGLFGLVPDCAASGDVVAICPGARVPFILRFGGRHANGKRLFQLVGMGYFHDLNDGVCRVQAEHELESIILN